MSVRLFLVLGESLKNAMAKQCSSLQPAAPKYLQIPSIVWVNMPKVHLLDYAAGNIRSLVNAIEKLGWEVAWVKEPNDVAKAEVSNNEEVYGHVCVLIADTWYELEVGIARRWSLRFLSPSIQRCWLCGSRPQIH